MFVGVSGAGGIEGVGGEGVGQLGVGGRELLYRRLLNLQGK